jgi:hypothetical protein
MFPATWPSPPKCCSEEVLQHRGRFFSQGKDILKAKRTTPSIDTFEITSLFFIVSLF